MKHNDHAGYYSMHEDFAVSVEMYVLHGKVFRDYMGDKPILALKYNWIKTNVFAGKEFNTGDPSYKSYVPNLYAPGSGILSTGGIHMTRPNYRWNHTLQ